MRCPQCARTVEQDAPFCACGYPVFWDERPGRRHPSATDEPHDLSRVPGEQTLPPPSRRAVEPADLAPPTEQLVPLLACPDCGIANPVSRTLCRRCGARLQPAEAADPASRLPRRRRIPAPVLVLVALALSAAAVWSLGVGQDAGAGEEPAGTATPDVPTATAQPSVAPPSPTASETAGVTHVVAAGETLTTIAQLYGVTVEALVEANGIANPDLVDLGQELVIPAPGAAPSQR